MRTRLRSGWILAVGALCALMASAAQARPPMERFTSRHYALWTDAGEDYATESLAVLEAAWPQLEDHFGAKPPLLRSQRLEVRLYRTRAGWTHYAAKGGLTPKPEWAGCFDGQVASLYLQSSDRHTRTTLLHEAVHQFHRMACCPNGRPRNAWYTEGVAEHLCHHTWDGGTLCLGVVPPIVFFDGHAARAARVMRARYYDLLSVLRGVRGSTYSERWAIVRFLTRDVDPDRREAWERLRVDLDNGRHAIRALPDALKNTKELLSDILAWLPSQHEPLEAIWTEWTALSQTALEGNAVPVSVARVREPVQSIGCTLEVPEGTGWEAGLLLSYKDAWQFTSAHVLASGSWRIMRRSGDRWEAIQEGRRRFDFSSPLRLRASRSGQHVSFEVNGQRVTSVRAPQGSMGFSLQNAIVRFLDLHWAPYEQAVSPALQPK